MYHFFYCEVQYTVKCTFWCSYISILLFLTNEILHSVRLKLLDYNLLIYESSRLLWPMCSLCNNLCHFTACCSIGHCVSSMYSNGHVWPTVKACFVSTYSYPYRDRIGTWARIKQTQRGKWGKLSPHHRRNRETETQSIYERILTAPDGPHSL